MDPELERFKTDIDLRQYAAALGYALDRRKSSRSMAVMRNAAGDKVIIKRETDGHYVYFSVHDPADNGTIIDFVQRRSDKSLGEVRVALRPWIGEPERRPPLPVAALPALERTGRDQLQVERDYACMRLYAGPGYLEERGIDAALLASRRFAGRIRLDSRGNAIYPHHDGDGTLCGFEKKNRGFSGFASGGTKGLANSRDFADDRRIVFAESFIDMLSYAALFPDGVTRYRSFGGGLSPAQLTLMRDHVLALPPGSEVIAATDADEAGQSFAAQIGLECSAGYMFRVHSPASGDWNDALRASASSSLPTARIEP